MKKRRKESGFALLMVFLLAACVAIMLYMEMPRVAFEAERQKELLLIDRGNQFKRAIQVFVTDKTGNPAGRYPASIDELESFNNHRYLRRKYVDPMTGKPEWRLIHATGVPGIFPDSVTMKSQNQNAKDSGSAGSDYIKVLQSFDAPSNQQQQGGVSAAMRRRPSDAAGAPGSVDGGTQTAGGLQGSNGDAGGAGNPGSAGSIGLPGGGGVGLPGRGGTGTGGPGATAGQTQTCTAYIGGCAPTTTGPQTGGGGGSLPGQAGSPGNLQTGGLSGSNGTAGGIPGGSPGLNGQQPGMQMNPAAQTAAAGMIQNLLTTPRPGGMPANNPGTIVGGGIAGVASKFESEGIMVINDRTAVNEWEYIFDTSKYRRPANPLGGGVGTPVNGNQGGGTGSGPGVGPGGGPGIGSGGGPGVGPGGGGVGMGGGGRGQ
jgi:hypothetical protein